ncbi:hypothetical protein F5148DRAFT_1370620 [Russula earlei]|uniref:Uncharacterized protein n=1 Tax=Russula earlei TaxID=71964 RepID=A0ACC0TX60_9AGAM|nr:hypothetical protein F5148DRAFT_1370620 [Russula earlei]
MSHTPPTSPQQSHTAAPPLQDTCGVLGSPEGHRTPARQPVEFQGQIYHHLPDQLAAQLAALPPMPAPTQHHAWTPLTSVLSPAPAFTRSTLVASGSGSGSGSGSSCAAASVSVYATGSATVVAPDLSTNPPFPLSYPNRQYHHLPADLAAQLATLPPPPQRRELFNGPDAS